MAEPTGEWRFRLDAAERETEALRSELAAREAAAVEAKLAALEVRLAHAEAENLRLRTKVNALAAVIAEVAAEP